MTAGTSFAATPDLSLAAYGLTERAELRVIDLRDGKELWTAVAADECVTALAFSPDGKTLASGWRIRRIGHPFMGCRHWQGNRAAGRPRILGEFPGVLAGWQKTGLEQRRSDDSDLGRGRVTKCLDVLRGHRLEVWRLALLPDHNTLVSGCKDGTVCFWDTSVRHSHEARITLPEPMTAWCFAPDSQSVVTSDPQGRVTRWQGRDFQQPETLFEIGTNRYPECDLLSSDGRLLAVTTTNNVLQVWDLSRRPARRELPRQAGKIWAQSFSADGNKLVTWSGDDNVFREWDLNSNSSQPIHSWGVPGKYLGNRLFPGSTAVVGGRARRGCPVRRLGW